ncbi:hypothetical protein [Methylocystis parvus]|uniref:hypothetical protein n=1 Tax=Methylocystis parvus TaxID=134 RepID=UPI003C73F8B4
MNDVVPLSLVADAAGVSRRALEIAAAKIVDGKAATWRGAQLVIVPVKGRGGKAGLQYQVRVDSLPSDLQSRINAPSKALSTAVKLPVKAAKLSAILAVFGEMFAEIDATRPNTKARADIFRAWSERLIVDVKGSGHSRRYSITTLKRFYREHQAAGLAALTRRGRSDKGRKRVVMTARYDAWARKAGLMDLEAVAENVKGYIRGWHKAWESVSAIRLHAIARLEKLTRERGFEPPDGICNIPLNVVKAERRYRRVAEFKKDRKAFEDKSPAIRRTIEGLWPMDTVVGDVHPLDFFLPEIEGYQRYAKAICWLDLATKRLWATVVILPRGKGIRNAHVIASFMEMAGEWGLPRTLYLDNGKEYNFAEFIADALSLDSRGMAVGGGGEHKAVRHARPYAARSKAIEGVFAQLRHLFAKVQGYVGGDRMKSKVANVGKAPVPFPSIELFPQVIAGILTQYHAMPQGKASQLAGLSPIEAYNRAVEAGWQKTEIDPDAFATVFAETRAVAINRGAITVNGRTFYFDGLVKYVQGNYVNVRVPKYEQWARLPVEDLQGNFLGFAQEDQRFSAFDPAGARESDHRRALQRGAVRVLDKSAPTIDVTAEILAFSANAPKALPAPIGGRVTASDNEKNISRGLRETPKAQREREDAERQREFEIQRQLDEEFMAKRATRKAGNK